MTRRIESLSRFRDLRNERSAFASEHELAGNHALAYLARWSVLEDFARRLGPICQRGQLEMCVLQWQQYLQSGQQLKPPKPIPARAFELADDQTATIPQEALLQMVLPLQEAPVLYKLLATGQKYRNRRNKIAHFGEGVSEFVYTEFKRHVESALEEIDRWLKCSTLFS